MTTETRFDARVDEGTDVCREWQRGMNSRYDVWRKMSLTAKGDQTMHRLTRTMPEQQVLTLGAQALAAGY